MEKKLYVLMIVFSIFIFAAQAATERQIKVHFLYGSKPAKGCKRAEMKAFGGLKGGHVSIEMDGEIIGFIPVEGVHLFSQKRNKHSLFISESLGQWQLDTLRRKYTTVILPLTEDQYQNLRKIHKAYLEKPPYDYAFFGMRCASATNEILAQIGITRERSRVANVIVTFYPQLLRRRLLGQAAESGWTIHRQSGRSSRKWERE